MVHKRGVNSPSKYCMSLYSCEWLKNKYQVICNKDAFKSEYGTYCSHHYKLCQNKDYQKANTINIESKWTDEHEKLNKKYSVSQLRQILRDNKKQNKSKSFIISGNKKELIHRIVSWGLENHTITDTSLFTTSITDTTLFNTFI